MNKYSSLYLSEVFNGIQKLGKAFDPAALESMRRGSIDPGIGQHERDAYAKAYAKATRATANAAPGPTAAAAAPPPNAAPRPTAAAAAPPPNAAPRPTAGGASNAGFGPKVPGSAAPAVNPSLLKQVMKVPLKGNLLGAGLQMAGNAIIPKVEGDGFWAGMGNEARDFALAAGSGAAGAAAVSGGTLALPGAIQGAAVHTGGKIIQAGKALYDLDNYEEESANNIKKYEASTGKSQAQMKAELEQGRRLRAEARASATAAPPPASTAPAPASTPVTQESKPIPLRPGAGSSLGPVKSKEIQQNREKLQNLTNPAPQQETIAANPVTSQTPVSPQSTDLTPQQRVNKATVDRVKAQRDRAYEYAGVDPQNPPQNFSGIVPPQQQTTSASVPPTATISSTPPATPTPPKPQAVAQATPATPAKANTSSTPVYAPATPVAPKSTNATPAMQTASTQGPDDAFLNKVMGSYNSSSPLDKRKADAIKKVYKPGMTPSQIYADKGYISASRGK